MTKNKTYLLIAIIAIILLGSIININAYSHKSRTTSYWTEQSDVTRKITSEVLSDDQTEMGKSMSVYVKFQNNEDEIPIEVEGCKNLELDIKKKINVGVGRYLPIYKITKFDSEFEVSWTGDVTQNGTMIELSKRGSFNIEGKYTFKGLHSAKFAKKVIEDKTLEQARKLIAEDIRVEIDKIRNAKISNLR